jgi:hypothetical protein
MIIPLALGILVIVGVRVIRAKDPTAEQDSEDIAKWENAKRIGFLRFCLRRTFPFVLGYCVLGPMGKSWTELGRLSYPTEEIGRYILFAVFMTLVVGGFHWLAVRAGALEASGRRARAKE